MAGPMPCPFCAREVMVCDDLTIFCPRCELYGPSCNERGEWIAKGDADAYVAAWNRRDPIAQARAEGRREGIEAAAKALDAAGTPLQPVYSVAARIVRALLNGDPDGR